MAIVLEANYAKKLGLPNFSSHQYSVTIRTELTDLTQVEAESTRLYGLLQEAVDREIQEVGFMPDASCYGMYPGPPTASPATAMATATRPARPTVDAPLKRPTAGTAPRHRKGSSCGSSLRANSASRKSKRSHSSSSVPGSRPAAGPRTRSDW